MYADLTLMCVFISDVVHLIVCSDCSASRFVVTLRMLTVWMLPHSFTPDKRCRRLIPCSFEEMDEDDGLRTDYEPCC